MTTNVSPSLEYPIATLRDWFLSFYYARLAVQLLAIIVVLKIVPVQGVGLLVPKYQIVVRSGSKKDDLQYG